MRPSNDLSRSLLTLACDATVIAVVELSQKTWLVGAIVPGINRHPEKKIAPDEQQLLRLLHRWRDEAGKAGHAITRLAVAFEAGRDGFWLARWLRARGIEAYVIHPTSIPVSREHRRAKTDRLDIGLLKRSFLGWLRGEPGHCSMAAIPTLEEEDAKRPTRERENLVGERTRVINRLKAAVTRLGIRGFNPKLPRLAISPILLQGDGSAVSITAPDAACRSAGHWRRSQRRAATGVHRPPATIPRAPNTRSPAGYCRGSPNRSLPRVPRHSCRPLQIGRSARESSIPSVRSCQWSRIAALFSAM
jgi:hypothetical protein